MNINENMIKQTNKKNLSDSDKGEIRKIKVVRRAGHDDSLSVSGRLRWEARVSGWAGLQRKTLLLPIQIKKPQKRTKKGGWVGGRPGTLASAGKGLLCPSLPRSLFKAVKLGNSALHHGSQQCYKPGLFPLGRCLLANTSPETVNG